MLKFIGRNLLAGIVMVFVISTLTFFLLGSNGASIARTLLGENATPAQIEAKEHGLSDSIADCSSGTWTGSRTHFVGTSGDSWLNVPAGFLRAHGQTAGHAVTRDRRRSGGPAS